MSAEEIGAPLLSAALGYADQGLAVFPCRPGEKAPLTRHGLKDATTEAGQIRAWWERAPEANIGLPTGGRFDVVDIDGVAGRQALRRLAVARDIDAACFGKVATPRDGGMHLYLPASGAGNAAGLTGAQIDYRGRGGYVVAPPSVTAHGRYRWTEPPAWPDPEGSGMWRGERAPNWRGLIRSGAEWPAALGPTTAPHLAAVPAATPAPEPAAGERHPYAAKAIRDELAKLDALARPWREGARWDATTFEVACNLIELANASWSGYAMSEAERDMLSRAPADEAWGVRQHRAKWDSARQKVGTYARPEPREIGRVEVIETSAESFGAAVEGEPEDSAHGFDFWTVPELRARVAAAGPRRYLLRGIWPCRDYGVHAAEHKAQKTWTTIDLAVSVASGTPWLGLVEVDAPGPVVMFAGEGGEANILRRIDAVARERGLEADGLPIHVCARAPHLDDAVHLALMRAKLAEVRPVLVTLDPFYLSARSGEMSSLYSMGAMLEKAQHACQDVDSALWVAHHFNRKQGNGSGRISGAGPAEWGRVLISADVKARSRDTETQATSVVTELDIVGGEIPDQNIRVSRRIWADDPDDLDSPLNVETKAERFEPGTVSERPPAAVKMLAAGVAIAATEPKTRSELVDRIAAQNGHGLTRETASRILNDFEREGLAQKFERAGKSTLWLFERAGCEL